jgi:hypothetical protein
MDAYQHFARGGLKGRALDKLKGVNAKGRNLTGAHGRTSFAPMVTVFILRDATRPKARRMKIVLPAKESKSVRKMYLEE